MGRLVDKHGDLKPLGGPRWVLYVFAAFFLALGVWRVLDDRVISGAGLIATGLVWVAVAVIDARRPRRRQ